MAPFKKIDEKCIDLTSINTVNQEADDDVIDGLENFLKGKEVNVENSNSSNSSQISVRTKIETILKTYYINQIRSNHKINILKFWKSMDTTYPEIYYILAKIVFSVPPTQVSVERLFSGLKFILSPYRSK